MALVCTFRVDSLFCGVPVAHVRELLRYTDATPVPLGPPEVAGLVNLRGQVVTAVDLRTRLGRGERDPEQVPTMLVVRRDGQDVSLLVDSIDDVIDAPEAQYETVPETMDASARTFVAGVYKLERELLVMLDINKVMDILGIATPTQL